VRSLWGDYHETEGGNELVEGWFAVASRRLGKATVPILVARLLEGVSSPKQQPEAEGGPAYPAALCAPQCLWRLGAAEAIPALLEAAAQHPDRYVRESAAWAVAALRMEAARKGSLSRDPWEEVGP
jgi:HEAT repeat protein